MMTTAIQLFMLLRKSSTLVVRPTLNINKPKSQVNHSCFTHIKVSGKEIAVSVTNTSQSTKLSLIRETICSAVSIALCEFTMHFEGAPCRRAKHLPRLAMANSEHARIDREALPVEWVKLRKLCTLCAPPCTLCTLPLGALGALGVHQSWDRCR